MSFQTEDAYSRFENMASCRRADFVRRQRCAQLPTLRQGQSRDDEDQYSNKKTADKEIWKETM